jgi:YD repeat-containing protein
MKYLLLFCAFSVLLSCGEEEEKKKPVSKPVQKEVLTETKDGTFTQYYPGKKKIKFQGPQDKEGQRHGIWYFYDESGRQISMTDYKHGKKHGVSLKRYPNGQVHYTGEYENDVQVGIWKTYDANGKLVDSTNYTELNEKFK